MHFHDIIFLGLAVVLIILMLTGRDLLNSRSPLRQALTAPARALAKNRQNARVRH